MSKAERVEIALKGGDRVVVDWTAPAAAEGDVAVFVHGLGSNRRGEKALHFAEQFRHRNWGFLSVDLRGHGESVGSLEDLTLTRCLEDLSAVLAWVPASSRPPVLIGSSMGGAVVAWHALLHPISNQHLVLIAPSLQFPSRFAALPPAELEEWRRTGRRRFASEWIDIQIGYGMAEDAARYPRDRLIRGYGASTLILHGMQDKAVAWEESVSFSDQARASDIELLLIKNGDHRLTEQKAYLFDTMALWLRQRDLLLPVG